ncbi:tRNA-dihydrouridine synthase C [Thalassoglobus neptunius]|uniref:tRNA-dihydrouridine synthase n=2 Tax=Thalassoglobus neptunius TaxID=1938619 RepID=A0A5C5WZC1_9PLAN|nr:tRNA-dihydrouridine synthase C [Thalassoglobus neptunius]
MSISELPKASTLKYGDLVLPSRYLLSPLAGFTNLPFRRICREIGGVGLCTTDLVSARGLLEKSAKSLQLIQTCEVDSPYSVQIFGPNPDEMHDAAQFLEEFGVDSIDINMGCPVDRITKGGAGSAMMCSADQTIGLVQRVVEAVKLPVSVKMRLGWDSTQLTAPRFAREFEQVGVVAVAIHGRTREQGFSGDVDLDGIRQVVEAVESIPVIGNGDIRNVADAERMFQETGCQGISIGRGALANPWIFRQLCEWETTGQFQPPGNFDDRLELMLRQFGYLEEMVGPERAILMFRKMGHWYLKGMRVRKALRHQFQTARSQSEIHQAVEEIRRDGPVFGSRTGVLPEMNIQVPSGPVERW